MQNFLDFEKPLLDIKSKIEELRHLKDTSENIANELSNLQDKYDKVLADLYENLTPIQKVKVCRHQDRPKFSQIIDQIFDKFEIISGDRLFSEDRSIKGGFGRLDNKNYLIIGNDKGNDIDTRVKNNFGMAKPEGYRKAKRLMLLAEQFSLPVITFVDTAGAYPGIEGEERCQSEAIARNLATMSELKTPILVVVSGEGGSGGALAISVGDHLSMLEYAIYSVASPEACASIIWREAEKAPEAAKAMKVSSKDLKKINIIDEIITEPLGGAHRDYDLMAENIKSSLIKNLSILNKLSLDDLLDRRYKRILEIGS